jgi:non-heme chloroperoxidase
MRVYRVVGGGGIGLHVEEAGNPAGRPILFIHGFSQCRLAWRHQFASDLAADFRLVALDIRGHGLSDAPPDAYGDSRLWADDIAAMIDQLGLDGAVIVGWSYAGLIVCDYLRFHGEGRLGGLHFVAAATKSGTKGAAPHFGREYVSLARGYVSEGVEESVASMSRFVRLCYAAEPDPAEYYLTLGYNLIVQPRVRRGLLARRVENDDILVQIRTPTLIAHGIDDAIVLKVASEETAAAIPHARVSFYEGVGHSLFAEDAPRFNRELRTFVEALG